MVSRLGSRKCKRGRGFCLAQDTLVMDDVFRTYLSSALLTFALIGSLAGWAADLEYISPEQTKALADQFSGARLTEKDQQLLKTKKAWSCDMYGMRTKLQVQHGIKLYQWKSGSPDWTNTGAQPVAAYKLDNGTLVGKSNRLEDDVRMTPSGRLISRLTLASRPNTVLAYSVCSSL
jgi:hypothetical protein